MATYTSNLMTDAGYSDGSRCDHPDNASAACYWPLEGQLALSCAKGSACVATPAPQTDTRPSGLVLPLFLSIWAFALAALMQDFADQLELDDHLDELEIRMRGRLEWDFAVNPKG
jgi:hypothetical protein